MFLFFPPQTKKTILVLENEESTLLPLMIPIFLKILGPCVPRNVDHAYHGQVLSAIIAPPDPSAVDGLPSRLPEDILCVFLDE